MFQRCENVWCDPNASAARKTCAVNSEYTVTIEQCGCNIDVVGYGGLSFESERADRTRKLVLARRDEFDMLYVT